MPPRKAPSKRRVSRGFSEKHRGRRKVGETLRFLFSRTNGASRKRARQALARIFLQRQRRFLRSRFRRWLPPHGGDSKICIRRGSLEVRLATRLFEVKASQSLRYKVFYKEMNATASAGARITRRDKDHFDRLCDHLLVIDHEAGSRGIPLLRGRRGRIVGTYRLLPQAVAEVTGGFYTQDEYDLRPLIARHPDLNFVELGRSCVLKPYRTKQPIEMLWQGIWQYVHAYDLDVMIGVASLEGTSTGDVALPLSFLHHHARAPQKWDVKALPSRYVEMNLIPKDEIDMRQAMRALPPLIKGYLRLGAYIGNGAVIDHQFGTTDVAIILPVSNISERYKARFEAEARASAQTD
ncbi:Putative hemolysin [hydrothermal vent metagenome]|uniref:Hemolysin n=1 Tax=hydrothermal vent metagenome TaxID=652676 RepID=A0A3B0SZ27_9ZZZZ